MNKIRYETSTPLTLEQFQKILLSSTLAERRPMDDLDCLQQMVLNANVWVSAWDESRIIGVVRGMSDFSYTCYLSELAVDTDYQKLGIGRELVNQTRTLLSTRCKIRLIAAPAAGEYYSKVGFVKNDRCWELK